MDDERTRYGDEASRLAWVKNSDGSTVYSKISQQKKVNI